MTRSRRVFEALVAGGIVYVLMAACSSGGGLGGHTSQGSGGRTGAGGLAHGGQSGTGGVMGSGGTMGSGGDSSLFDALTDPVPEAMAGLENPQSGTRLKAKYIMGSDGSKQYPGPTGVLWYDSMLMTDCAFVKAADQTWRCLPTGTTDPFSPLYTDSQCTQPITGLGNHASCFAGPPVYIALPYSYAQCDARYIAYQVGAVIPAPQVIYMHDVNLGCIQSTSPPTSFTAFYALTTVPPSAFVQGTLGVDP